MKHRLTSTARALRKNQTDHERKLWRLLRAKRLQSYKFRRQFPIGDYVVDFCCPQKKFIVELDGGQHNQLVQASQDMVRDDFLAKEGYKILRIWNNELDTNTDGVLERIVELLQGDPSLGLRPPSPTEGRGQ